MISIDLQNKHDSDGTLRAKSYLEVEHNNGHLILERFLRLHKAFHVYDKRGGVTMAAREVEEIGNAH